MDISESAIAARYAECGNSLGWRLLAGPKKAMSGEKIAFIGLNPGGSRDEPGHARYSVENGSAYEIESWAGYCPGQAPLQKQVLALFRKLDASPRDVLSGNLVPFRSKSWASLKNKRAALAYGEALWTSILAQAKPRLVITMGAVVNRRICRVLGGKPDMRASLGWGTVKGFRNIFDGGIHIGLPHLSRFAIIDRPASEQGLSDLFGKDWMQ
ncbi:hypothetical protein [Roseivivax lentus]|uniref:hypothetical protein n=1 Tax=Roseivivax lentus TaxID=633194 RepID=UPI00117B157F|nr:hypothetical protein [Roseivivax lentus]